MKFRMESEMSQSIWSLSAAFAALVLAGCSDPVPPAPRGNLVFTLTGCTTYTGGVGAQLGDVPASTKSIELPAPDGTRPGRRIEDGQEGSNISCKIDGGQTNSIEATISGTQSHPSAAFVETVGISISEGYIQKTETGGTGQANITLQTGGVYYRTPDGSSCTLSLDSSRTGNQFMIDAGRAYARFDCPALEDPPTTGCRASGAFVLERCEED